MDDLGSPDLLTALLGLLGLAVVALGFAFRALLRPPPTHPDELPPATPSRSTEAARVELEDAAHRREKLRDEIAAAQAIPDEAERRKALADIGRRERAKRRGGVAHELLVVLAVLATALILAGCPARTPPATFGSSVPELPVAEAVEPPPPTEHPCPIAGVTAGQPMPQVDAKGLATCGGFLVDDQVYVEWLTLPADVELWRTAAVYQRESALDDRARCELVVHGERTARIECQRDARVLRVAVPAAFVGGSILSAVLTYGLMSLAQAVSP